MASDKKSPVIKKVIKKGHGGHHGGSWKVAYADFVTAMMAFFLVMWLLAISSEQGKAALADYFQNLTMTDAVFNGGMPSAFDPSNPSPGILTGGCFDLIQKGQEIEEKEKELDEREKNMQCATVTTVAVQDPNLTHLPEGVEGGEGSDQSGVAPGEGLYVDGSGTPGGALTDDERKAQEAKDVLAAEISAAATDAMGGDAEGQFTVEKVPGGLRLELMDKEKRPVFISGQPRLTPVAQDILGRVAEKLETIPNKISIEGHTDAVSTLSQELTNWELSTARASAARRFLSRHGIADDRVTMVAGFAATRPLPNTSPTDPVNRRISIMIWDQDPGVQSATPRTPGVGPGTAPSEGSAPAGTGQAGQGAQGQGTPPEPGQRPAARPGQGAPGAPQEGERPSDDGAATPPASGATPGTPSGRATPPRATRQAPKPAKPTVEELERQLLDETLKRAATPDTSTAGPPVEE
ncbi:MAG: OmpA family protein [Deltaproteobacteria bacterium]|nr:OmpA family protein [Deltaproteobacteria bacterium]